MSRPVIWVGITKNPSYEDVCSGKTGHVETVEIEYDPAIISYEELLDQFWSIHDPTTLNRQGVDKGSQYRSVIFYYTSDQEKISNLSKKKNEESKKFDNPIVTEIVQAKEFYQAEEYHQRYYEKHSIKTPICHVFLNKKNP